MCVKGTKSKIKKKQLTDDVKITNNQSTKKATKTKTTTKQEAKNRITNVRM